MRFIQIGTKIINLDQITSAEYNPEESHPGHPAAVFSSLKIHYTSNSWTWDTFYESEADSLWALLKQNATLRVRNQARDKAIAELIDLIDPEQSLTSTPD